MLAITHNSAAAGVSNQQLIKVSERRRVIKVITQVYNDSLKDQKGDTAIRKEHIIKF